MNDSAIEKVRDQLACQLRDDYFDKLHNEDDPSSERYALISTISLALDKLIQIESNFLTELLADSDDGICPCCLAKDAADVANAKSVANAFNFYLTCSHDVTH
jgi:hypothetical protein